MVNKEWSFKESLFFIDAIKKQYEDFMLSFSIFGGNYDLYVKIYDLKKNIYSLQFEEWKKDKLWEYLNNDIDYIQLWNFV